MISIVYTNLFDWAYGSIFKWLKLWQNELSYNAKSYEES